MSMILDLPPQARSSLPETSDLYPAIRLNGRWRVIVCCQGIQWVLQYRASAETYSTAVWRGRSFCRTSEALIRCGKAHAGAIDPAALAELEALPPRIGGTNGQV
jgi:hypothetical protein